MPKHFTASAFVTHGGRVLLILHREKALWLPPGGHLEPDESPAAAAIREVWEETGLWVRIASPAVPAPGPGVAPRPEACLEIEVSPAHTHLDLVYFARVAVGQDPAVLRPNAEVAALHWWSPAEIAAGQPEAVPGAFPPAVLPPTVAALAASALRAAAAEAAQLP